ncbi:hypothetical protein V8E36_000572 [Tilletia maclaganii]
MRIDVRLPAPSAPGSRASSTSSSPPIAKLAGTGELVMIELQGALEFEELDPTAAQLIGTLTFEGPQQSRPILLIAHHRLYGKFVDVHQPLAVLRKHERDLPASLDQTSPGAKRRWLEQPWTSDVESGNEDEGSNENGVERRSVKRARREEGREDASSPPPPSSSPCRSAEQRASGTIKSSTSGAEQSQRKDVEVPAKSAPQGDQEGDESAEDDDWDEDESDHDDDDAAAGAQQDGRKPSSAAQKRKRVRRPRVWYDVVCVIRRKILFSQRPEPVVNLAPDQSLATAKNGNNAFAGLVSA